METDRSAQGQGNAAFNTSQQTTGQYGSNASQINSTLIPTLTREAQGGGGYTPTQTNAQLVAGEQGAGGATAGVVGQAGLNAARTHNTGSTSSILDQAARRNAQVLSGNALGVQTRSADLAQQQKQQALGQLGGMYGTDVNAQLKAMGIEPEDINATVNAGKSGWLQNTLGTLGTVGQLGEDAAKSYGALFPG